MATAPGQAREHHSWVCDASQIRRRGPTSVRSAGWLGPLKALRKRLAERLNALDLPGMEGLPSALLLGESSGVPAYLKDRFTRTGTRHLLALSGLHIGLIWFLWVRPLCHALCRCLPMRAALRARCVSLLTLVGLLALVPLLGSGTPALRAALAFGLAGMARQVRPHTTGLPGQGRRVDAISLWSFALVFECLHDPASLRTLSTQLSYSATLGLILAIPLWKSFWSLRMARCFRANFNSAVDTLGRPKGPWSSFATEVMAKYIVGSLAASGVASLATLPMIWIGFGEWSPMGWLGTLLLMPFVALGLLFGGLYLMIPWALPTAWVRMPFQAMAYWLQWTDGLPGTPALLPMRATFWIVLWFALLWTAIVLRGKRACAVWRITLFMGAVLLFPWRLPPSAMEVHVLDVGHGTCVVTRMPCGRTVIFDAGSRDRRGLADRALLPFLRSLEVGPLQIVLSHTDRDHAQALPRIASRKRVTHWLGPWPNNLPPEEQANMSRMDITSGTLLGPDCPLARCSIELLRGWEGPGNEGSRNLLVRYLDSSVLLCGDAEEDGLVPLFTELAKSAPLRALLAPHHGSEQPHWSRILEFTAPEEVWFSAREGSPLAQKWQGPPGRMRWTARDGPWSVRFTPIESLEGRNSGNLGMGKP